MASKTQPLNLFLILLTFSVAFNSSHASTAGIAIHWGQNNGDGDLSVTCDTGNYDTVILSFLNIFGCGRTPAWNFAGHCGDWSPCTKLQPEIQHCQQNGVKVFLSLGGASKDYSLCSSDDAKQVANYLYANFLTGHSGPLGSVTLDGIDFDIESDSYLYWDDLARELDALRKKNTYFYLSAAPQCVIPDRHLDTAIRTGLFDYVFVQFYNNPQCQYDQSTGDVTLLLNSWDAWTSLVISNNTVFMGLPASTDAATNGGYIPPTELISKVIPQIKETSNYGGIMLWDRFHDVQNNYSSKISGYVSEYVLPFVTSVSNTVSEFVSLALQRMIPKKTY